MIRKTEQALRNLFRRRSIAYGICFPKDGVSTGIVLADLARFCRADKSTFHADARKHAVLEGRREVFLRIQKYLKMTPDEIFDLHVVGNIEGE